MDERDVLDPGTAGPDPSSDTADEPRAAAPALPTVVAVVVTHNPGPWFEEALGSLVNQDYPNLSILVFDTDSDRDPTHRIAEVAPKAYVRRLERNTGPGAAVNNALSMVEGAPFFLLCHDDVALAPNAVRLLVEEAYRSNAGIVGPKLVRWDQPEALLAVGMGADRFGAPFPLCERNELDQEQHDGVRDVFYVPSACFLIRADLLRALGGFDEAITYHGEDTDLCWRAHLAGARVLVAPNARVRHLEALGERRPDDRRRLQTRHRLRMVLTNYGWFYLLGELVQQAVLSLLEVVVAVLTGRFRQAREVLAAWAWNARRIGSITAKRRAGKDLRQITDLELRRLQVRGSARVTGFLRGQIGGADANATLGDSLRQWISRRSAGAQPQNVVAVLVLALVLLFGSRHLLTRSVPAIGEFVPFPGRARDLLRLSWSSWRDVGIGSDAAPPTAFGLLGLAGLIVLGATDLLRSLLIVGSLPMGLYGMWRLGRFGAHSRAKAAMVLAYAANPLPYNALVAGQWRALALYALLPWVVRSLAAAGGLQPFADIERRTPLPAAVAAVALQVAALAALAPSSVVPVLVCAVALVLGSVIGGQAAAGARALGVAVAGSAVGLALHAPWLLSAWSGDDPDLRSLGTLGGADSVPLADLLHFHSGRFGGSWVSWGLLLAGLAGLVIGRSWRLGWAARGWALYALPMLAVAVVQAGWVDVELPAGEVLLSPAAVGVAVAVGAGMAAFDIDLPAYRFGWRQLLSVVAAGGLFVALIPLVLRSFNGQWDMPRGGYDRVLGFVDDEVAAPDTGPFRVLWLGRADVLPAAGWPVGDGVTSYALSTGYPALGGLWSGPEGPATEQVPDALVAARSGGDNRLGQRLGALGVRYVVVVDQLAPAPYDSRRAPAAEWLDATLASQLDLAEVELNGAVRVYRNTAWWPLTMALPAAEAIGPDGVAAPLPDPGSVGPALRQTGLRRYEGELDGDTVLRFAAAATGSWRLEVDGRTASATEADGVTTFTVEQGGAAVLSSSASPLRMALLAAQVLAWLGLVVLSRRTAGAREAVAAAATLDQVAAAHRDEPFSWADPDPDLSPDPDPDLLDETGRGDVDGHNGRAGPQDAAPTADPEDDLAGAEPTTDVEDPR
ncbi:MAG: glycosyltransferase family 2 protein [Acidimicrobiales bacterium]